MKSSSQPHAQLSWSGLPIIFDEVFTGLYRLGRKTSASYLGVHPDIVVNAKLLTGGLVPLCATLASQDIFNAFASPEKSDALLHGHSYTAHTVGCQVALDSLSAMNRMDEIGSWDTFKDDWKQPHASNELVVGPQKCPEVWATWSHRLVNDLSYSGSIDGVYAIGTVLSISMKDTQGAGEFPEHFL